MSRNNDPTRKYDAKKLGWLRYGKFVIAVLVVVVVALAGDTIDIKDGVFTVNGEVMDDFGPVALDQVKGKILFHR